MMKLRFSCGIGGNIAKNSAPYMTAYYNNNTHVGGIQGTISNRPNPDLRWEKTTTANIGVDFSMFRNRLNGSIEYYNKSGVDLLANTNGVPTEGFGFSTYTMNNGKMRNRGFELTLSSDVIMGKDWNWNVGGVLGYNKNKVTYVNVKAPAIFFSSIILPPIPVLDCLIMPFMDICGQGWIVKGSLRCMTRKEISM